jgi:hypothetical protein
MSISVVTPRVLRDREERFGRPGTVPDGQHNGHRFSCPH